MNILSRADAVAEDKIYSVSVILFARELIMSRLPIVPTAQLVW